MIRSLIASVVVLTLAIGLFAKEPKGMEAARKEYEQSKAKDPEAAREHYVATLAKMLGGYVKDFRETGSRDHNEEMGALNAELKKHPAPKDIDGKKLAAFMPGEWDSPRHEYLYKKDGTFLWLPDDKDSNHGKWSIKGNQFTQSEAGSSEHYTIILLNAEHFVYGDKDAVFYMGRPKK